MAHKSGEPGRLQSRKKRLPRDRGEKYVAPPIEYYGERSEEPERKGVARSGEAHELVRKLKPKEALGLGQSRSPSARGRS